MANGVQRDESPKRDLKPLTLLPLATADATARSSLERALEDVRAKALKASGWYWKGKTRKKYLAMGFRYPVLLLGALAAGWPLAREILAPDSTAWMYHPLWSTLMLILAGLLLAYDRFGDYTSGWVRYVRAGTRLNAMTEQFEIEMAAERIGLGDPASPERAERWYAKCGEFIRAVNGVVENETEQWAVAFQEAIRQLDENLAQARQTTEARARQQADESKPGAINIEVPNGDVAPGGWRVQVDGGPAGEIVKGKTTSLRASPGVRQVRVEAMIEGKVVWEQRSVVVAPNAIAEVRIGLPVAP